MRIIIKNRTILKSGGHNGLGSGLTTDDKKLNTVRNMLNIICCIRHRNRKLLMIKVSGIEYGEIA